MSGRSLGDTVIFIFSALVLAVVLAILLLEAFA
jgi:hypothetical protein